MPETDSESQPITILNDNRRRVRLLVGMTLDELAQATAISKSAISKHETGVELLSPERQKIVDNALRQALGRHTLAICDLLDEIEKNGSLSAPASFPSS